MKKIALLLLSFSFPFVLSAQTDLANARIERHKPKGTSAGFQRAKLKRNGGNIIKPGSGYGNIVIANSQSVVPVADFRQQVDRLSKTIFIPIEIVDQKPVKISSASAELERNKWFFVIFLVDDADLPSLLIAPESRWGFVNVKPLAHDNPTTEKLGKRLGRELIRGVAMLCGGTDSQYKYSIVQPISSPGELDLMINEFLPPDVEMRIEPFVGKFGVKPYYEATYREACIDGWAPAPTNKYQQAIWEKFQADKERGPVNAIKIQPPSK